MSPHDDEILGNLPRSRPGRRSERRAPSRSVEGPSRGVEGPAGARTPRAESGPPLATDADIEVTEGGDALSGAVRGAANLARVGLKAASQVAGGVLGRLRRR